MSALHKGEILIVDDTVASLKLLSELLTQVGYIVRKATDGEMALITAIAKPPELILLDIKMPGMDGYETCKHLKAHPDTQHIPVIFLSAMNDTDAILNGFKAGGVDYVSKPYMLEEVLARVCNHLELSRLRRGLESAVSQRTYELQAEVAERELVTQELLLSQQRLQALSANLEEVREAERARLASDLHDELGQSFTVMKLDLTRLIDDTQSKPMQERLQHMLGMLDQAADTVREISENLRPGMLDLLGLAAAVEVYLEKFEQATGINCRFHKDKDRFNLDPRAITALYRVLQESMNNIAKHAEASEINVQLFEHNGEVMLVVEDNGIGVEASKAKKLGQPKKGGFGVIGMSERLRNFGGRFHLDSDPEMGTRIEAYIPLMIDAEKGNSA